MHAPAQSCHSCRWRPNSPPAAQQCRAQADDSLDSEGEVRLAREVGEDAGVFNLESESGTSWVVFFGVLGTVLAILYEVRETLCLALSSLGFLGLPRRNLLTRVLQLHTSCQGLPASVAFCLLEVPALLPSHLVCPGRCVGRGGQE